MALKYSTKLREFLAGHGSMKRAFEGGVMELFTGGAPADADAAEIGTKLVTISLASGIVTYEVLSFGTITLSGSTGQVDSVTVNGVTVTSGVVPFNTDLNTTAQDLADNINKYTSSPDYIAEASGAVVTIKALPGTGTGPNGYVLVSNTSGGDLAGADVNMASGIANVNGLTYGGFTAGKLVKKGIHSGVNAATGVAGYFRIKGSVLDAGALDASPFQFLRLQGTIGTSGADYNLDSTSLQLNAAHTMDTWDITIPAA